MSESRGLRLRVRPVHVFRWLVVVVVLIVVATGVYAAFTYQHFVSGITHLDAIPAGAKADGSKDQNILLVGDDHRPANASAAELARLGTTADGGGTNTDSMLVLHIPSNGTKASLISLPRDSWVSIPGYGKAKLNAAFAYGSQNGGAAAGAQLLVTTVQNLTGLHIDHFVRISMLGFYDVAAAIGPITVCLVAPVNDPYSTFVAPAGISTLDAGQTLAFVRQRHGLPQGDLDRQARQRYFLGTAAKALLSPGTLLDPGKTNAVLSAISHAIQTDPGLNFLSLATQLKDIAGGNLVSTTIPISGTPTISYKGSAISIVEVDHAAMPGFVARLDTPVEPGSSASPASGSAATGAAPDAPRPGAVRVDVMNGGGVAGAAASTSATLHKARFVSGATSTVAQRSATTIQYPAGQAAAATLLARYVPGASLEAVTGVDTVTLVLGTDGAKASSRPSAASGGGGASGAVPAPTGGAKAPDDAGIPCLN